NRAVTRTKRFRAAVCWEGVADLRSLDETSLDLQSRWRGGTPDEMPERWSAASPLDRSERVDTPVLLYYGALSNLVGQAGTWSAALRAAGAKAEVVIDPAAGHTFSTVAGAEAFRARVGRWFLNH
ncbi:MAG TPA: prolyl oligopeptidase family serine peptidase, partial [Acidimicrobiales bacterium]|nr:prolyl oligopeptidase family serine peptidase [Acidimicrobiales bacterium]